jgi:16S rRNA processing protein RimM
MKSVQRTGRQRIKKPSAPANSTPQPSLPLLMEGKADDSSKMIVVGRIGRPHGVIGWLKLNSFTDPPENIFAYPDWFIEKNGHWSPIEPLDHEIRINIFLIKLPDCNTPEQASLYTNINIAVSREQLALLPPDEHYWTDLEGLTVINCQGVELGKVDHLLSTGANDVLVVKGQTETLIPYIKSAVLSVDLEQQKIMVDWEEDTP